MNEQERVKIVIDILSKLKKFKSPSGAIIDLYSMCSFIPEFKRVCNEYIKTGIPVKGTIPFEELDKKIEYSLSNKPLFVIKNK